MFFKIGPVEKDDNFSWRIVKNPDTKFHKKLSNNEARSVYASFDEDKHFYKGYVANDKLAFLETARKLNMESYLHPQLDSICPHNLKGFDYVFRSVLRGNKGNGSPLTDEEFLKKDYFVCQLGPFPHDMNGFVFDVFESYDLNNEKIDHKEISFMLQLSNSNPIPTTEFFQKVYLLSYFLTQRYSMTSVNNEQVLKFSELCKTWLNESKYRNRIINTLSKRNKSFIKSFEYNIIPGDEEEKEEKIKNVEEKLNKEGLHQKRHDLILNAVKKSEANTVVDLGCSEGKLLEKLSKCKCKNILGIDANNRKINKLKRKLSKSIDLENSNILFPLFDRKYMNCDFLILCEVIEHFHKEDREKLLYTIINLFSPKEFILTTPNYDYNKNYGMEEGEYRHRDHKIEYNEDQIKTEVLSILEPYYDCELSTIGEGSTFVIHANKKENVEAKEKLYKEVQDLYNSHYIDVCNYMITKKELSNGYSSFAFIKNHKNIFYLAPTMSPVDYNPQYPDLLEHPYTAFDYYKQRGIDLLIGQEKYMGSRGYILFFKDPEHAKLLGYDYPLIINSRGGFPFFNEEDKHHIDNIWKELDSMIEEDFLMLDCEIMPWIYKAGNLANYDFRIPGECAYLHRMYTGELCPEDQHGVTKANKFLNTLDNYTTNKPIEIRPFHMLAKGNIKITNNNRVFFNNTINGFSKNHLYHMEELSNLINFNKSNYFHKCNYHVVHTDSDNEKYDSKILWDKFCEQGGEGFVYKPYNFINFTDNMYHIQPAVKVRGKDYLRMVYGIDYLDPDYFEKVSKRSIKRKRVLAVQEHVMSMRILQCFLNRNNNELYRSIAGFLGMENVNMKNIDATL